MVQVRALPYDTIAFASSLNDKFEFRTLVGFERGEDDPHLFATTGAIGDAVFGCCYVHRQVAVCDVLGWTGTPVGGIQAANSQITKNKLGFWAHSYGASLGPHDPDHAR